MHCLQIRLHCLYRSGYVTILEKGYIQLNIIKFLLDSQTPRSDYFP